MEKFRFIKGLELENRLSPEFAMHFEEAMIEWQQTLLPLYAEAKKQGAALLTLCSMIGHNLDTYSQDGVKYVRMHKPSLGIHMYLSYSHDEHIPDGVYLSWQDYVEAKHGDLLILDPHGSNFSAYNWYFSRVMNDQEPYNGLALRLDEYFRQLTGDEDVHLSVGQTCHICFGDTAFSYSKSSYMNLYD